MSHQQNIARIESVQRALGDIVQSVVYVGGATVSLYADRPAGEIRPTLGCWYSDGTIKPEISKAAKNTIHLY